MARLLPPGLAAACGCAALLALPALVAAPAAQTGTGSTFGAFLLVEPSARVAAQGNAGATARASALDAYYNPGGLGFLPGSDAAFAHNEWIAGIDYDYAAVALRLGDANTVSLSVTSLRSGDIDVRTPEQPLGTGERFSVQDLALGVGYARRFTERFAAGGVVKLVSQSIYNSAASTVALDAGVMYRLPLRGAVLGASISNFGTSTSFDGNDLRVRFDNDPDAFGDNDNLPAALETDEFALPIFFRVGVSLPVEVGEDMAVTVSADALQPSDNSNSLSLGGEWTYAGFVSVRAGYDELFQTDAEGGLRVGAGVHTAVSGFDVRVDYAWADHGGRLGSAQRFSLGIGF